MRGQVGGVRRLKVGGSEEVSVWEGREMERK